MDPKTFLEISSSIYTNGNRRRNTEATVFFKYIWLVLLEKVDYNHINKEILHPIYIWFIQNYIYEKVGTYLQKLFDPKEIYFFV